MLRKIFAGILISLSILFFLASLAALGVLWYYKAPLEAQSLSTLAQIDLELETAQIALKNAGLEIERTLRIVEAADKTLSDLKGELDEARSLFGEVDGTLSEQIVPSLQNTRDQINLAITAVQEIRTFLNRLQDIPFLNLDLPTDDLLGQVAAVGFSLDTQIASMQTLVEKASLFLDDASYLMGGDLSETRQNMQDFLKVIDSYQQKISTWRLQVAWLTESLPGWSNLAAIVLTILLLWFAFSQFGLFLHGLSAWRGGDLLAALRKA